jgi:secreted PhoX family phosphatase
MVEFSRRTLMATATAAALGASVSTAASSEPEPEPEDGDTPLAPTSKGRIERFATTALGAEVTGPEVTTAGTLFFSLQHPSRSNPAPFNQGGVGYVRGYDFDSGSEFDALSIPNTNEEQSRVRVANGEYKILAQEGANIGGNEDFGIPVAPNGLALTEYPGSRYANLGYTPDCNRLIPTNDEGTEGYLYTNFETSPGNVTQMPVSRNDDGTWEADLQNTKNLANTEELRSLGGTRINCYGDTSPWGTYLSAEEEYSHPRVSLTTTVSDIIGVSEAAGPDHRGAAQFYNRPNPDGIPSAIEEYYGDDSWYPQGAFALAGLELHAYYLGATIAEQNETLSGDVDLETSLLPLSGPYPNPYRYGKIVEFRDAASDSPQPVKHHVFGRAAWECPDVQTDEKTVYLSSDGDSKGFYKFVADERIPSYDDPMDITGTLYVALVTNQTAAADKPPAKVPLELDWIEMGTASNKQVESWIAEYDDVDQLDYFEKHTESTDWQEDIQAALEEADKTVVEEGNQSYIPDKDIVEWAKQYEENGPDGVDEDLKRVPFLETRAAAKEIDATVEFRKSEGIDSAEDAQPGDYIYLGLSEINDGMIDDMGEINLDRVDGGVVYRAEIEEGYNISTLEPVIVGPDATDPADVANDALLNIDNVFVMDDDRVLCCEDAAQYGRTYPNDCLYVYTPDEEPSEVENPEDTGEVEEDDDADDIYQGPGDDDDGDNDDTDGDGAVDEDDEDKDDDDDSDGNNIDDDGDGAIDEDDDRVSDN